MEEIHTRQEPSMFAVMIRRLRKEKRYKHREVAKAIGISTGGYGNAECSPYKVIRRTRAETLAKFYDLDETSTLKLMKAWERCPLSPFGERRKVGFDKRNARRSRAKLADRIEFACLELCSLVLEYAPDDGICICTFEGVHPSDPDRPCEFCSAMLALGLDRFTTRDAAISQLAALQAKIDQAKTAPREGAA